MVKNKDLFDKMVKAQQSKYYLESKIIQRIEDWFKDKGLYATAKIGEYNLIRISVTDSDCSSYYKDQGMKMCNFDINEFLDEFDFEVHCYEHGWKVFYDYKGQLQHSIIWRFYVQKRSDLDV